MESLNNNNSSNLTDNNPTPESSSQAPNPPQNNTQYEQIENIKVKGSGRGMLVALLGLLIVLLLIAGVSTFLALVAYGKVEIGNKELERKISFAIQSIPFTPKTAEFLINSSMEAQSDLQSVYINASIAAEGGQSLDIPGLSNSFDFEITGPIDAHDEENIMADINIKMAPQLDADLRVLNDKVFTRINSIPDAFKGLAAGVDFPIDMIMSKWMFYDLGSLETDARASLDEDSANRDEEQEQRVMKALLNSKYLDKVKVSETDLDGVPVYEMSLDLNSDEYNDFMDEMLKAIDPELYSDQVLADSSNSTYLEDIKIKSYVDKETSYILKYTMSFRMSTSELSVPTQVLGASTIQAFPNIYTQAVGAESEYVDIAVVLNTTRHNEEFEIEEPTDAVSIEEVIQEVTSYMMMQSYQRESELNSGFNDSYGFDGGEEPNYDNYIDGYFEETPSEGLDDSSGISEF